MRKITFIFSVYLGTGFMALSADSTCHKCEVIREQNAKKTDYYQYYDDYLKDHPEAKKVMPQQQPQAASKPPAQQPKKL